jgi:hypothetical protein
MIAHPHVQIRYNSILEFVLPEYPSGNKLLKFTKKAYSGNMSAGSRKRVIKAIDILLQKSPPKYIYNPVTGKHFNFTINFITLTVSENQIIDFKHTYDNLLKPFLRILREKFKALYVWKAELQKRGQIHYHLTTNKFIEHSKVSSIWNNLQRKAGYLDAYAIKYHHFNAPSIQVKGVRKINDLAAYLSKYVGKQNTKALKYERKAKVKNDEGKTIEITTTKYCKVWDCSNELKIKYFMTLTDSAIERNLNDFIKKYKCRIIELEHCRIIKLPKAYTILPNSDLKNYLAHIS